MRRPPLHTCAVAVMMIAHIAYKRSQDFNGPIGSITRKISKFDRLAKPFVYLIRYQWLASLAFLDYVILLIVSMLETYFPKSRHVFNKMENAVQYVETMPGKFDDAMRCKHHQCSVMDQVLVYVISWLNFFIARLTHWRSEEKDINIKKKGYNTESITSSEVTSTASSATTTAAPTASNSPTEKQSQQHREAFAPESKGKFPPESEALRSSYKEALEKGAKRNAKGETKRKKKKNKRRQSIDIRKDDAIEYVVTNEGAERGEHSGLGHEYLRKSDPIMEMFASGWLTKTTKEGIDNRMSLSTSFTG